MGRRNESSQQMLLGTLDMLILRASVLCFALAVTLLSGIGPGLLSMAGVMSKHLLRTLQETSRSHGGQLHVSPSPPNTKCGLHSINVRELDKRRLLAAELTCRCQDKCSSPLGLLNPIYPF